MTRETWNTAEILWTVSAIAFWPPALLATHLAWGDLRASWYIPPGGKPHWRLRRAALWFFAIALTFLVSFSAFVAAGFISGSLPDRPVTVDQHTLAASTINGALFLMVEYAMGFCTLFGLRVHYWIRASARRRVKDRVRDRARSNGN